MSLLDVRRTTEMMDQMHRPIARLTLQARADMGELRLLERDFLLNYRQMGPEGAKSEYVAAMKDQVSTIRAMLRRLQALSGSRILGQQVKNWNQEVVRFDEGFEKVANLIAERGHKDDGVIGRFRTIIHGIEDTIKEDGSEGLLVTMLQMRRHEKDYLLRGEEQYITALHDRTRLFKEQIEVSKLDYAAKQNLLAKADEYRELFDRVVEIDRAIALETSAYRATLNRLQPLLVQVGNLAASDENQGAADIETASGNTVRSVILVSLLVLVAGVFLAALLTKGFTAQIRHIMELFSEIGIGNFSARTQVVSNDELGKVAESLNGMLESTMGLIHSSEEKEQIQTSIMKLLDEISDLADGNLTVRAEVTAEMTGAIADAFNSMAEQLSDVVRRVKRISTQVSQTSQEVSGTTENLAEMSESQAVQIADAITSIQEMAASIQEVAKNAAQSTKVSERAKMDAEEGGTAVEKTNQAMEVIREHVQETARAIKRLGESSQEVGNIVRIINDIADRTSILALNASIQAAMAGDAGRGFAVVAEEVQRLAERSTGATKQIETLIKNIQGEIAEASASMEESIQEVVAGSKLAEDARKKLSEIQSVSTDLAGLIHLISRAAENQAKGSEEVSKTMEEVGDISSQTSGASRRTAVAMLKLAEASDQLMVSVSAFKLETEKAGEEMSQTAAGEDSDEWTRLA